MKKVKTGYVERKQKLHTIVIEATQFPLHRDNYLKDNNIKRIDIVMEFNTQYVGLKETEILTAKRETVVYMIWTIIYLV